MAKLFHNVEIEVNLTPSHLLWPHGSEVDDGKAPCCNHSYCDMRGVDWETAELALEQESELLEELAIADDTEKAANAISDLLYDDCDTLLMGFDMGVGATIYVLSAIGCIPISSCNGGAFGGHHHEDYPLIAFYARAKHVRHLVSAAKAAHVGLDEHEGLPQVYAQDIRNLHVFARNLARELHKPR